MTAEPSIADRGNRNRWSRGEELYHNGAFERISSTVFIVENPKGGVYVVKLEPGQCGCEDFRRHTHIRGFKCKHILATERFSGWLRKSARALAPMFGGV
jgi:hypothetical protein